MTPARSHLADDVVDTMRDPEFRAAWLEQVVASAHMVLWEVQAELPHDHPIAARIRDQVDLTGQTLGILLNADEVAAAIRTASTQRRRGSALQ